MQVSSLNVVKFSPRSALSSAQATPQYAFRQEVPVFGYNPGRFDAKLLSRIYRETRYLDSASKENGEPGKRFPVNAQLALNTLPVNLRRMVVPLTPIVPMLRFFIDQKMMGILEEAADMYYESLILATVLLRFYEEPARAKHYSGSATNKPGIYVDTPEINLGNIDDSLLERITRQVQTYSGFARLKESFTEIKVSLSSQPRIVDTQTTLENPFNKSKQTVGTDDPGTVSCLQKIRHYLMTHTNADSLGKTYQALISEIPAFEIAMFEKLSGLNTDEARNFLFMTYIKLGTLQEEGRFKNLLTAEREQIQQEYEEFMEKLLAWGESHPKRSDKMMKPLVQLSFHLGVLRDYRRRVSADVMNDTIYRELEIKKINRAVSGLRSSLVQLLKLTLTPNADENMLKTTIDFKHTLRQNLRLATKAVNGKRKKAGTNMSYDRRKNIVKHFEPLGELDTILKYRIRAILNGSLKPGSDEAALYKSATHKAFARVQSFLKQGERLSSHPAR